MRTLIATLALAAALSTSPTHASGSHSESCGQSVITVGDVITKVRRACGEPLAHRPARKRLRRRRRRAMGVRAHHGDGAVLDSGRQSRTH